MRPDSLLTIFLLAALTAFGPMSTDMYLPSLPELMRALGADVATAQLTLSVFVAGFALGQLIYGPLSDRYGRRGVLAVGLALYFIASVACSFASTIEALIVGRFVQAMGASVGPVLGRAIARDLFDRDRLVKVMSFMSSAMALAPLIAPIVGGQLQVLFGWRASFLAMAAFGGLMLLAVGLAVHETNRQRDPAATRPRKLIANFRVILADRRFRAYTAVVALAYTALFSFISGSSFVLIGVLGLGPEWFGPAFAVVISGYVVGSFVAGKLSGRLGIERLVAIGTVASALAAGVLAGLAWAGVSHLAAILLPTAAIFCAMGLTLPAGTAAAVAPFATRAGTASSLLGFLQLGFGALGGLAVGHLHDGTARPMATVIFVATFLSFAIFFATAGRRRSPSRD